MEHFKVACEPYYFEKKGLFSDEIEVKVKYSDMIDEDKSLLNLVKQYIKQAPKYIQDQENREAKEAKQEARLRDKELQMEKAREAEPVADCQLEVEETHTANTNYLNELGFEEEFPLTSGEIDINDEIQNMQDI